MPGQNCTPVYSPTVLDRPTYDSGKGAIHLYEGYLPWHQSAILNFANKGLAPSPPVAMWFYVSRDGKLSGDDLRMPGGYALGSIDPLPAGGVWGGFRWIGDVPVIPPGRYSILGVIDPQNKVAEKNEQNNLIALPIQICRGAYNPELRCDP